MATLTRSALQEVPCAGRRRCRQCERSNYFRLRTLGAQARYGLFLLLGCERIHDIVDEVAVADDISEQEFVGPSPSDVVVTTWHDDETLEETLDFFATCAVPTEGFVSDSDFRLVICVANQQWAAQAKAFLESAEFFA